MEGGKRILRTLALRVVDDGDNPRQINMFQDDEYYVICAEHPEVYGWCAERALVIKRGWDAQALWEVLDERGRISLFVPVAPKESVWVSVDLVPKHTVDGLVNRCVAFASRKYTEKFRMPEGGQVGTLNRGEGRRVLSFLLRNAMEPALVGYKTCVNRAHRFSDEEKCQAALTSEVKSIVFAWKVQTISRNGHCPPCYTRMCELAVDQGVNVSTLIGE